MSRIEKISISLTGELLADVQGAVASGDYASTSEVVREALREWRGHRTRKEAATRHLQHLLAQAEASGYVEGPLDVEAIKADGRKRLAQPHG